MPGEKTEKATPKRKQDERKKGNVFQSQELVTVASLFVVFYTIKLLSSIMYTQCVSAFNTFFGMAATVAQPESNNLHYLITEGFIVIAIMVLPAAFAAGLTAIIITFAQTRGLVSGKAMAVKFNRLNPLEGFKRMFALRGWIELLKALVKVSIMAYLVYDKYNEYLPQFARLFDMEPMQAIVVVGDFILSLVTTAGIFFLFLAVADYVYQWWDYEKKLRMSKDEIKEEYKQTEGDPQVKGKIKEKQRAMAQKRMMQNVPKADVVIRNPTHYAVALGYDADNHHAPVVLAKGMDLVALRIVEIAEENHVPTIENKPLARGLYAEVELEQEIPEAFYQPVAEVLAFVYSLKKKDLK